MINARQIAQALNEELKPLGFTRKGLTWYLRKQDIVAVLRLQKSRYDNTFFLNIGFWLRQIDDVDEPKEEQCHVRSRAEELWPTGSPSIGDLLSEDAPFASDEWRIAAVSQFVKHKIVPLLVEGSTLRGLRDILSRSEGWLVRRSAGQILGLKDRY